MPTPAIEELIRRSQRDCDCASAVPANWKVRPVGELELRNYRCFRGSNKGSDVASRDVGDHGLHALGAFVENLVASGNLEDVGYLLQAYEGATPAA